MTEPAVPDADEVEAQIQAAIDAADWTPLQDDPTYPSNQMPENFDFPPELELGIVKKAQGGWQQPPNPAYHPCVLPELSYADAGRPWVCGVCGGVWTLVRDAVPATHTNLSLITTNSHGAVPFQDPGFLAEPTRPGDGITKVSEHAPTCPFVAGKGMCSCEVRKRL